MLTFLFEWMTAKKTSKFKLQMLSKIHNHTLFRGKHVTYSKITLGGLSIKYKWECEMVNLKLSTWMPSMQGRPNTSKSMG
jgi:hypothetical protein